MHKQIDYKFRQNTSIELSVKQTDIWFVNRSVTLSSLTK